MVYGRNLHPGSVINHHAHGWAVVDRVEPFGPGSAHADVWLVGVDKATKVGIASSARRSPALRSAAALARTLWAEVRRLRSALEQAAAERDQALAALARIELDEPATPDERALVAARGSEWPGQMTDQQIIAAAARHHIGGQA